LELFEFQDAVEDGFAEDSDGLAYGHAVGRREWVAHVIAKLDRVWIEINGVVRREGENFAAGFQQFCERFQPVSERIDDAIGG